MNLVNSPTRQLVNSSTGRPARRIDGLTNRRFHGLGFTMAELIVAVGILVVLMGIAIVLGPRVLEQGKEARVKIMLQTLSTIAEEYSNSFPAVTDPVTGRSVSRTVNHVDSLTIQDEINWDTLQCQRNAPGYNGSAADPIEPNMWDPGDNPVIECSIERFVWATLRMPFGQELYKSFRPNELTDTDGDPNDLDNEGDGFLELRDPWGNKFIYVARVDIPSPVSSESLALREDNFLPVRSRPYFASAGKDGLWGTWDNEADLPGTDDASIPSGDIPWDTNRQDPYVAPSTSGDQTPDSADNFFSFQAAE